MPRLVEISWQLSSEFQLIPAGTFDTLESLFRDRKVTLEENISSVYDANIRSIDAQLQERLYRKLSLLGRADSYTDSAGSTTHSARESAKKCIRYDPGTSSSTAISKRTGYSYTFGTIIDNLFDQNVSDLLDFLGLKWEEELRNFQKTALARGRINTPSSSQVIKPLYKTASYRWKHYEEYLEQYKTRLAYWIQEYGY